MNPTNNRIIWGWEESQKHYGIYRWLVNLPDVWTALSCGLAAAFVLLPMIAWLHQWWCHRT